MNCTGQTGAAARRAFTLLELVLVLALIALVLGAAAPAMRGFTASRSAADAASDLLALTRYAHSLAIAQGSPCRIEIDSAAGGYWLTIQEGGVFVERRCDLEHKITVPDGVTIALRGDSPGQPPACIEFHPSGRRQTGEIEVRGRQGEVYRLTCVSPTEPFRLITPAEGSS